MSKRKKGRPQRPEIEKEAGYYDLKTKAVEDLVTADESNSPEVSEAELRAYRSGLGLKIPEWLKLCFIKAWFAGAVCFFFMWGLGGYLTSQLDLLLVTGMALGAATDLLIDPALRFFERSPGANDAYMMFPKRGFISLPLNILYGYVLLAMIYGIYAIINLTASAITGATDTLALGVEPILFGLFYLGCDSLLLWIKHRFLRLIHREAREP